MSDATNQHEADFRGNRETKRRDETVMIGQESLASMVDEAKAPAATDPSPTAHDAPADAPAEASGSNTRLILLATGAVIVLVIVVVLVYSWVS